MFFPQSIPEVILIKPRRIEDTRGYFSETYRQEDYEKNGVIGPFLQDNHSYSTQAHVLRGLHFQSPPTAQAKLVRCTHGRIYDVAVDIRKGSPTYGAYVGVELSAENGHQLYIPVGFAHGFCTLTTDCEVQYKVSAYYDAACDKGLAWNDPDLAINWPPDNQTPTLSQKDAAQPNLRDLPDYFTFSPNQAPGKHIA